MIVEDRTGCNARNSRLSSHDRRGMVVAYLTRNPTNACEDAADEQREKGVVTALRCDARDTIPSGKLAPARAHSVVREERGAFFVEVLMPDELNSLRQYLATAPRGALTAEHASEVEALLANCWDQLDRPPHGGMREWKILGRTENMRWEPPILSFNIERHGAAALGSVYAAVQSWRIDVATASAVYGGDKKRLIRQKDAPLNAKLLAQEIAALIVEGKSDPRLKRLSDGRVRLDILAIIPETNKQTTASRRQRFADAIDAALAPHRWHRVLGARHLFESIPDADLHPGTPKLPHG
jgi:hypothetical protein